MKDHSALVKTHFDSKYGDYDLLIRKLIPKYDEMHRVVVDVIDFPADSRLNFLDLGIGTGQTSFALLKKFPDSRIDGIDISEKMLTQGKERLNDFSDRVHLIEQDIKNLTTQKEYDACVAVLCVHHLNAQEKQKLFQKIFRSLRPRGIFVIGDIVKFDSVTETQANELKWKKYLTASLGEKEGAYWFENYQEEDLPSSIPEQRAWLKNAGFDDIRSLWAYLNFGVLLARKK